MDTSTLWSHMDEMRHQTSFHVCTCLSNLHSLCLQLMYVGKVEPLNPPWHKPLTSPHLSNRDIYSMISINSPTGSESQLCPGLFAGFHRGDGWEEDVGQADVGHGQHLSPSAPGCGHLEQLQTLTATVYEGTLLQIIHPHNHFQLTYSLELYAYMSDSLPCILRCCNMWDK